MWPRRGAIGGGAQAAASIPQSIRVRQEFPGGIPDTYGSAKLPGLQRWSAYQGRRWRCREGSFRFAVELSLIDAAEVGLARPGLARAAAGFLVRQETGSRLGT